MNAISFRAAGVTFENRQGLLCHLEKCPKANARILLFREPGNKHDANAIKILAATGAKRFQVGYVPKDVAAILAPLMDADKFIRIKNWHIIGGQGLSRGLAVDTCWA